MPVIEWRRYRYRRASSWMTSTIKAWTGIILGAVAPSTGNDDNMIYEVQQRWHRR